MSRPGRPRAASGLAALPRTLIRLAAALVEARVRPRGALVAAPVRPAGALAAALAFSGWALAAGVTQQDDAGVEVRLPQPAQRIVSLSPHATELLFAAGAGSHVVGVSRYSDYPPAARTIRQVGDSAQLDLETLASLQPDLVVAWGSALPARSLAALRQLGVPVFRSEPHTLEAIAANVERLGALAGTPGPAAEAGRALRQRIDTLRMAHAGVATLTVFVQVWPSPLMTVNRDQVISDALRACGARNLFDGQSLQVPTVDPEAVVQADPDAIVAGVKQGEPGLDGAEFRRWRALPRLRAVARAHLIGIDADLLGRPGPRFVDATETLCRALDAVRAGRPLPGY